MQSPLAASLMRLFCAAACCLPLAVTCRAADPNKPLTEYTHTVWTHKDGIPSAFIYAIAQTSDGYLWLATTDGLVRFDGVRFVHWRPKTGYTALLGVVRSLCAARDGSLWIGTETGLIGHIRGDDLTTSSVGAQIEALLEDHDGTLWVTLEIRFFDSALALRNKLAQLFHCQDRPCPDRSRMRVVLYGSARMALSCVLTPAIRSRSS